jgi:hypothetical protein
METKEFLTSVGSKIGGSNAFNLLRDAELNAYREIFMSLGISEENIESETSKARKKIAQDIKNMPVPSNYNNSI